MAVTFVCLALLVAVATADQFTAMVELERTLHAEGELAEELYSYISKEEERLGKLRELAEEMAEHSREVLKDPVGNIGNPVNAYQLVKRYTVDWDEIQNTLIYNNNSQEFCSAVAPITANFPDRDDYKGAIDAMLRLQDTYALDTEKVARGILPGVRQSPTMTALECFEMGRVAYDDHDHYHTIQWMQTALNRLNEEEDKTIDEPTILDYLSYAMYVQGNVYHAKNLTQRWLELQPDHQRAHSNLRFFTQMIDETEADRRKKGDDGGPDPEVMLKNDRFQNEKDAYRASDEFQRYEALCRGEDVVVNPDAHKLTCQYQFWHPMFKINPLREEIMSLKPWIAVYHQLMTEGEIEHIKKIATPRLNRATVVNSATGQQEHAKYRISKTAWLKDEEDPIVAKVSQRCSALTNLSLSTVEELQISNYGIGGQYEPHFDYSRRAESKTFEDWRGNRILTVIYYMTDVEAGGGTVFLNPGVKLTPEKGACGIWWNLHPSGEGDWDTRHAACPVLVGSKWVANKWFHERDQEFIRPCGLKHELGN